MPKGRHHSKHERIAEDLRGWGQTLGIYHLCDNKACHRAKICRGEARSCFRARFPQLPEDVRNFWLLLLAAKKEGLTWDEAMEYLRQGPEIHAWNVWLRQDDVARVDQPENATRDGCPHARLAQQGIARQ